MAASSFPPSQGSRLLPATGPGCPEHREAPEHLRNIFSSDFATKQQPLGDRQVCQAAAHHAGVWWAAQAVRGSGATGAAAGLRGDQGFQGVYSHLTLSGKLEFSVFSS